MTREQRKKHYAELRRLQAEERRLTAYHEAGHASVFWLFGNLEDLQYDAYIDMRRTRDRHASIRAGGTDAAHYIEHFGLSDPKKAKREAQRSVIFHLAGYAAQSRVDPNLGEEWLCEMLDTGEDLLYEEGDIGRAVRDSEALYGENSSACWFLNRMFIWTEEALSHPRLWGVVEALANRLQTVKTLISGAAIIEIMENAWGKSPEPYRGAAWMQMGYKWRRRFRDHDF